jgi:hypothetical protein
MSEDKRLEETEALGEAAFEENLGTPDSHFAGYAPFSEDDPAYESFLKGWNRAQARREG